MKRRYDLIVFDWEGTIAEDACGQVIGILRKVAQKLDISTFDNVLARKSLPLGLTTLTSRVFPELSIQKQENLLHQFQQALQNLTDEVTLTTNIDVIIKNFYDSGIKLGIATNKSLNSLQKALNSSGLGQYFQFIRTATQAKPKPCADMLEEIIWESGVANSRALMVGDSFFDIEMAVTLGVDAVGVDFYHEHQGDFLLAGAKLEIDNYLGLLDFIYLKRSHFS